MVQLEMTDSAHLPQLLKPTGLGHDFPAQKLLGKALKSIFSEKIDLQEVVIIPENSS